MKRYLLIGALLLTSGCSLLFPAKPVAPSPDPDKVVVVTPDDGLPDPHKQRTLLTVSVYQGDKAELIKLYGAYSAIADSLRRDSTRYTTYGDVRYALGELIESMNIDLASFGQLADASDNAELAYKLEAPQKVVDRRADIIELFDLCAAAYRDALGAK